MGVPSFAEAIGRGFDDHTDVQAASRGDSLNLVPQVAPIGKQRLPPTEPRATQLLEGSLHVTADHVDNTAELVTMPAPELSSVCTDKVTQYKLEEERLTLAKSPLPSSRKDSAPQALQPLIGWWVTGVGECFISCDYTRRRLAYEELVGNGSQRLHGYLYKHSDGDFGNCMPSWQACLAVLNIDEAPWVDLDAYLSSADHHEVVGDIQVRMLPGAGPRLATRILEDDDEDDCWQKERFWFKIVPHGGCRFRESFIVRHFEPGS